MTLYTVRINNEIIQTTVTCKASIVDQWIRGILYIHRWRLHKLIVGFDVEWRPSLNRSMSNPVAILQLCVGRRCLIFQLIHADYFPDSLFNFLEDHRFTFVGVGIQQDVQKLSRNYSFSFSFLEDLRSLAAYRFDMPELWNAGLKRLAWEVLRVEIDKPVHITLSNWDAHFLTEAQVCYATADAFLSFEIGRVLLS
ncbi:PREDICTED: Werner Syndrome-like exonuclease [Nelumbo nucifera]|uniref:Werner Syndrome-like exonuclease n=2 Tax=Nelumbo nucifera TaxID=4432 RepID=A0A1U8Q948_NELNU|nr:PREDICTED: Werner Syndrome-like exonuclease [Nelumbo nucifera]DAD33077.1 TPA_asm: hypothetical protein HUJ06_011928 [Nelumbo nucifera]